MQMICILLGVPEADRHRLFEAVEPTFDYREGREVTDTTAEIEAGRKYMFEYGVELIASKRERPADDMLSHVIHATLGDVDPPRLSDAELYSFFSLLFAAGADTTRNAIAGGLLALIEEMLRWTAPSPSKRRTATCRTELGGHVIEPGAKVLVWEGSANRDAAVFERGMDFDITRAPNPHLSFGHGVHFCLGANLARLEIRVLFEELFAAFVGYELVEPVEWARSNRHTGVRHMKIRLRRGSEER
jgi:cytochrome P450